MVKLPEYEVLNFCFDNNNGCSLTVLSNGERFHVTVDPKQFQDRSKRGKEVQRTYRRLLQKAKVADQSEEGAQETSQAGEEEDGVGDDDDAEDSEDSNEERDSAVDVSTPEDNDKAENEDKEKSHTDNLHRWILAPLADQLPASTSKSVSLHEWYHNPIQYYKLSTSSGTLQASKDSSPAKSLTDRLDEVLRPTISLPKKTLALSIAQISASDLTVLSCASDPAPYHPVLVSHDSETLFLKPVDQTQPGPTIREIHLLHSIAEKDLHSRDDFRCPQLRGLVHFSSDTSSDKKHITALLLTPIPSPTPLTLLLDPSTPSEKRTQWARDAERMVEVLHENGLVWGDAKGDNFLVDGEVEKVWMIDFGGSWTEGWVDEKLKETEEGDWQGTEKVVNALEDPVDGTMSEEEEKEDRERRENEDDDEAEEAKEEAKVEEQDEGVGAGVADTNESPEEPEAADSSPKPAPGKRSHDATADGEADDAPPAKQQKVSQRKSRTQTQDAKYCYCGKVSSGRMVACDGEDCKREWFHFECLGIEKAPEEEAWFCEECRQG